jgi:hypothetical protein
MGHPSFLFTRRMGHQGCVWIIRRVLVQEGRMVAFESKKLSETERRWPTHEKEMWVVIHCLKTWGHYIGSKDVVVWTDNVTLKYFATQPKLSSKQMTRQDTLALFNVIIRHKHENENIVLDALSRQHQLRCRNPNLAKCGGEAQHLEKLGIWSPPGLPNVQSSTTGPKTPRIGLFLVSLERS